MAVQYDGKIIEKFANDLYRKADRIIIVCAAVGMLTLAIVGAAVGSAQRMSTGMAVFFGLAGLVAGAAYGRYRAFNLRLEAQKALCQVEIERNTRKV